MLPIQTGHRENGNGPRLVIARPQRGRGNLREALAARTNRRQNGKRHQACHCEGASRPWQSRGGSCVFADGFPAIQPGTARLPRRFAPRNDTSGSVVVHQRPHAVACSPTGRSLSAATDAIGAYRFIGSRYGLQVPSRDCHVASLLAMTNLGAGSILSIPGTNRQCSAGRGMPLPYNGLYDRREYPEICNCPRRSLSAATDAIGAYYFNGGRYGLQVRCRARLSPPLHTRMPKLFRKDDVP